MLTDEAGEEHWTQLGPGATRIGWDLSFLGLALRLDSGARRPTAKPTMPGWLRMRAKRSCAPALTLGGSAHLGG